MVDGLAVGVGGAGVGAAGGAEVVEVGTDDEGGFFGIGGAFETSEDVVAGAFFLLDVDGGGEGDVFEVEALDLVAVVEGILEGFEVEA